MTVVIAIKLLSPAYMKSGEVNNLTNNSM